MNTYGFVYQPHAHNFVIATAKITQQFVSAHLKEQYLYRPDASGGCEQRF